MGTAGGPQHHKGEEEIRGGETNDGGATSLVVAGIRNTAAPSNAGAATTRRENGEPLCAAVANIGQRTANDVADHGRDEWYARQDADGLQRQMAVFEDRSRSEVKMKYEP